MMTDSSPWDDIEVPKSDFNVRQVVGEMVVPCFWGRDTNGAYLFIVEFQGDHAAQYRKNAVTVNGINIDLRTGGQGRQCLVFALEKQLDRDLFEGLCRTLATSLEHATDSSSSLTVSLSNVQRWKIFLAGRNKHLSAEEVQGLFAELTFLLELIDRTMLSNESVEAWLGAERSHQDFIFGNRAIEVKSLSGTERNIIRISSEDQLDSLNDALFLRIYRLSRLTNVIGTRSLNEVVTAVHMRLTDADTVEAFDRKLVAYGYSPLPDYDHPRFVISEVRSYRVDGSFPRLIRSQLPVGIVNVAYDIKLETMTPFECVATAVFEGV
ncbi:PD-(D/E)XK motif protein [Yersinia enterocolitica]